MKIVKVMSSGISRLIDAYKAMSEDDKTMKFSSKSNSVFENTEISLVLSDLKGIELLILRKFCPSLIVLDSSNTVFVSEPRKITTSVLRGTTVVTEETKKREFELLELSDKIPSLFRFIKNSSKVENDASLFGMFDIGSYRFKAIARFEGVNIVSLLNAFPEYLLFNNKTGSFMEEGSKEFENLCGQQFIMNFYSYMESTLSPFDILTDSEFDRNFLSFTSKVAPCVCTHIRNPIKELNMLSYESSGELIKDIKFVKVESNFLDYKADYSESFVFHFAITSSFETLLKFVAFSNLVYYYNDLKTLAGNKSSVNFPEGLNVESGITFNDAISLLDDWRINAFKNSETEDRTLKRGEEKHYSKLELFNFIPRGAEIKFMIRGTSTELSAFVNKMRTTRKNYVTNEIETIFNIIENNIKLIDTIWNMS